MSVSVAGRALSGGTVMPPYLRSTPNRIALGVTAFAVVAVLAWSAQPMTGRWALPMNGGGRPSLRQPVAFQGFGGAEPWGRWTVGDEATLTFGRRLPERFTVVLHAMAYGPNAGAPVRVCAGEECRVATFGPQPADVALTFVDHGGSRRLRFEIPHPTAPGGADTRKLGVGLVSVVIEEVGQ